MTNDELKTIRNTITMLTNLKNTRTDIPTDAINDRIKELQTIHTKYQTQKQYRSKMANKWNKEHPERHNEINKKSYKKLIGGN